MFWAGPDQWMAVAEGRAETDFADELSTLCPLCSITEQTDGFVLFEISSEAGEVPIHALMSKLVNLDPTRLCAGSATRTGLEHMSVFVIRRSPAHLAVLGMRSAAASLWHALETAVSRLAEHRS
jgi:sarcosine oxidase subunit gamma